MCIGFIFSFTENGDRPRTFAEYEAFCFCRGERLCEYEEICPTGDAAGEDHTLVLGGTPTIFDPSTPTPLFSSDQWVPFAELNDNAFFGDTWLQLGNRDSGTQVCWNHEQVVDQIEIPSAHPPVWASSLSVEAFMEYTVCCTDP